MDWECSQVSGNVFAGNVESGWVVDPDTVREDYTDPTLMATRQFCNATIVQRPTASFFYEYGAIGLIRWDQMDAGLVLNPPGPLRNCDADWIVRIVFPFHTLQPIGTAIGANIFDNTHLSKAKRRLGSNSGILCVFEVASTAAGAQLAFGIDARCLIKE
jgi:hypothetical protein